MEGAGESWNHCLWGRGPAEVEGPRGVGRTRAGIGRDCGRGGPRGRPRGPRIPAEGASAEPGLRGDVGPGTGGTGLRDASRVPSFASGGDRDAETQPLTLFYPVSPRHPHRWAGRPISRRGGITPSARTPLNSGVLSGIGDPTPKGAAISLVSLVCVVDCVCRRECTFVVP